MGDAKLPPEAERFCAGEIGIEAMRIEYLLRRSREQQAEDAQLVEWLKRRFPSDA